MLRLHKNQNVIVLLQNRELGLPPSPQKLGCNIVRQLITSGSRDFIRVFDHICKGRIVCEEGRIYLHNFKHVFSLWGYGNKPCQLYEFKKSMKLKDALLCNGCNMYNNLERLNVVDIKLYRGYSLVLSDNNCLYCLDILNGDVIKAVYLGSERTCKFTFCSWETFGETISLSCDVKKRSKLLLHEQYKEKHVFDTFAIFGAYPFEFQAAFEITENVFGKDVNKVNITEGTLIIGTGSYQNSFIKLYDFTHIMNHKIKFHAKLNQPCSYFENKIVGVFPNGLPYNCCLTEPPPLLFVVNCADYYVQFGGLPWHYVVMKPNQIYYEVIRVDGDVLASNGKLHTSQLQCERENVFFHSDFSQRLLLTLDQEIKVFKIGTNVNDTSCSVEHLFTMDFSSTPVSRTNIGSRRSQRKVIHKTYFSVLKNILAIDYDNELDLIAILGFDSTDASYASAIRLYDNLYGNLLKHIDMDFTCDELSPYHLVLDLDTIVIIEKNKTKLFRCMVYKLGSPKRGMSLNEPFVICKNKLCGKPS